MGNNGDMLAAMIQGNITYYSDSCRNVANRIHGGKLSRLNAPLRSPGLIPVFSEGNANLIHTEQFQPEQAETDDGHALHHDRAHALGNLRRDKAGHDRGREHDRKQRPIEISEL